MNPIGSRVRALQGALALALALGAWTPASATLISVDFGSGYNGAVQPLFSGVEPAAAALDPAFAAANVWNGLETGNAGVITDPSYASLLDSTGAVTGVGFSITGTLDSYQGYSATASYLSIDYLFWNAPINPSLSSTLSWAISGLTPGASYALAFYGANTDTDRSVAMTIDGYGPVGALVTLNGVEPGPLYLQTVVASAGGVISGTAVAAPGIEGDWAGFQIASVVPEPSTALLLASGLAAFAARRRRRPRAV